MKRTLKTTAVWMLSLTFLTSCSEKTQEKVEPIAVQTERAESTQNATGEEYVGTVEPKTSTAVSFTAMGMVTQIHVEEGQRVAKGQLIAEIDKTQAQNLLANAKAQYAQAQDALQRMKQLHDKQSIADMKWVEVQSQVEQAKSALAGAEKTLADCSVYAPVSGYVGSRQINVGETAMPGVSVVTLMDISTVKVKVSIPEKEMTGITPDRSSLLTVDALEGQTFTGGRIEKGVVADALTHTYEVKINIANPQGTLLPGMVAQVRFGSNGKTQDSFLSVPVRCVQQSADGQLFVWVVLQNKAHRKSVSTGQTFGNRIQILSGLSRGDQVIVSGYQKVSEGSAVYLEKDH